MNKNEKNRDKIEMKHQSLATEDKNGKKESLDVLGCRAYQEYARQNIRVTEYWSPSFRPVTTCTGGTLMYTGDMLTPLKNSTLETNVLQTPVKQTIADGTPTAKRRKTEEQNAVKQPDEMETTTTPLEIQVCMRIDKSTSTRKGKQCLDDR